MTQRICLIVFIILLPRTVLCDSCNTVQMTGGDTWLDLTWSLYCGVDSPDTVMSYTLIISDITFFTFNQSMSLYCSMMNCSALHTSLDYTPV